MISPEQILANWEKYLNFITTYISEPRASQLHEFCKLYEDRLVMMPASNKENYHNCFEGGYIDHVNRVIECALKINNVWIEMGVDTSTYTVEELVFSAMYHDLGKMGSSEYENYLPNPSQWHVENRGEVYTHNTKNSFVTVPDRSLFLLQEHGIKYSLNEMITIKTHDGLYDEANKSYLISYSPETKPRTSLPYIVHQADLMAARIEFEKYFFPKLGISKPSQKKESKPETKQLRQNKQLKNVASSNSTGLNSVINEFFQS